MNEIIITNQNEIDNLPDSFEIYTIIKIKSKNTIVVRKARDNSHVQARDNSHVEARDNSHVQARDNSHVEARDNSHVQAWDNSHVEARDNSHVEARDNSHVEARDNSHVDARDNSHVQARDNSHVQAWDNSTGKILSDISFLSVNHFAVVVCVQSEPKQIKKDKTGKIIKTKIFRQTKKTFCDIYKNNMIDDKTIILYKSVKSDNTDFYTGKIKYEGIVKCPDWNPDASLECGNGLHLSPTPEHALSYNKGKIIGCKVKISDFVVYPYNITKVRCKQVEVFSE